MTDETKSDIDLQLYGFRLRRLARYVWKHFQEDRCLEEAASLSYTSLLAMVPLLAVIFGVISAFPVFSQFSGILQSFIFDNFMPATGEQIETYMNTFLESVSSLTLPGTIMLIVTALLLMFRIEVAFNHIWRVDRARTLTNRVVMYWAVLTLGPILIGAAIALSAQNIFAALGIKGDIAPGWHAAGIFFLSWLVFTMMFVLVPNRRVQFRDAVVGAFLSAVLFEVAKSGFVAGRQVGLCRLREQRELHCDLRRTGDRADFSFLVVHCMDGGFVRRFPGGLPYYFFRKSEPGGLAGQVGVPTGLPPDGAFVECSA